MKLGSLLAAIGRDAELSDSDVEALQKSRDKTPAGPMSFLLDTNIISEPSKSVPDEVVVTWLDPQVIETLFISAITIAELRFGISACPLGNGKQSSRPPRGEVLPHFSGRILSFNLATPQFYSELMARGAWRECPFHRVR